MNEDLISREKAYKVLTEYYHHRTDMQHKALREALDMVPPAELQPTCNPDKISQFIDGIEELFADIRERFIDDSVCGLCEYDGAYVGESGDWCNECPGFEKDDCFKLSDKTRKEWTEEIIKALDMVPSADVPERNVGKWLEREVIHAKEAKAIITEWQSCKCSVCGCYDTRPYLYCFNEPRFCSWCGAEMRGEDK